MSSTDIIVYTDGSFSKGKNKLHCGYGIHFPNKELKDIGKPFIHEPLTNQRAELYAIYKALKKITENLKFKTITIYSDSEYSIKSVTKWIKDWKKNGWMTANNKPVSNQDIIRRIDKILMKYPKHIEFIHVRSHTGKTDKHSIGNDKADELAKNGALQNK